jgi:outer membrane receptor protein involved in Fe transport
VIAPNGEKAFVPRFNNVPKASARGAELELNWHPSNGLRLDAGIGLLRTRLVGNQNGDGGLIGREFQGSPHLTASAAADWMPVRRLRLSAQLRYHTSYFSDDFDSPELRIGPAATVDARAAYSFGQLTAFAYARNVFDSFHMIYLDDPDDGEAEDPRVVGVGLQARF